MPRRRLSDGLCARRRFPSSRQSSTIYCHTRVSTVRQRNVGKAERTVRAIDSRFRTASSWDGSAVAMRPLPFFFSFLFFFVVAWGPAQITLFVRGPGFREYTSHRWKLRISIGLTLPMEPESGRRREKVFLSPLEHAASHEENCLFREHEGN